LRALIYNKSKVDDETWAAYEEAQTKKQPKEIVVLTYSVDGQIGRPLAK